MGSATVGGITIGYDDSGVGDDALLLIHGHPFNRSMWQPQLDALRGSRWRVIAPDLRGYGASTVVPGRTPLDVFAADLALLLDHLGIRDVVVAGLSMGGQIAMEFCRQFPRRVRGLLLAATFPQAETAAGRIRRNEVADRLLREGMLGYAAEALPMMLHSGSIEALPDVAEHVAAMMRTTNPIGAAAALRGRAERPGYEETLAGLDVPSLVVVGDQDAFTTRADAERMRDLLKQSDLVWLQGIGHMPNLEAAADFNAAMVRLLDRVKPGE